MPRVNADGQCREQRRRCGRVEGYTRGLQDVLLWVRLVRLPTVAEEAIYRVQVGFGGGVNHVRVGRFPDVLPLGQLVLHANRHLSEGVDAGGYAANRHK